MSALTAPLQIDTPAQLAQRILEPLSDESVRLLKPIKLTRFDRLDVALDARGEHFIVQPYQLYSNNFRSYPSHGATKWLKRVPERRNVDADRWELAATDITALIINAIWPDGQLVLTDDARAVYNYLLLRFMRQTLNCQQRALYRINGVMPEFELVDHPIRPLATYQRLAYIGAKGQEESALFMQQGTGKTPIVIRRINEEGHAQHVKQVADGIACPIAYKALIVVPKNVRTNWLNEIQNFATYPGKATVLRGGQLARLKLFIEGVSFEPDCEYAIVICSYESVVRSMQIFAHMTWDLVVLDESHMIKSPKTARWKAIRQLRELSKARMVLTGTPVGNTLFDLWAQLEFLGEGLSGFTSHENFKSFYGKFSDEYERGGMKRTTLIGYNNLPILQERLARLAFMITKAEALPELPPKMNDIIEVTMTKPQAEAYRKIQNELILKAENMVERAEAESSRGARQIVINSILTQMLRLEQITSGFVSWDMPNDGAITETLVASITKPQRTIEHFTPSPKIEALREIFAERYSMDYARANKITVWACFTPNILAIKRLCDEMGIGAVTYYGGTSDRQRDAAVEAFNGDISCKLLIGNAGAGGVGLNLRGYDPIADTGLNCDRVIYYSQDWPAIKRSQSEDRAHRRGTRVSVQYTDLVVPGTIDEEIRARVVGHLTTALQIQDVRAIMERVLAVMPQVGEDD